MDELTLCKENDRKFLEKVALYSIIYSYLKSNIMDLKIRHWNRYETLLRP